MIGLRTTGASLPHTCELRAHRLPRGTATQYSRGIDVSLSSAAIVPYVRLANCPGSDEPPLSPAECKTLQLSAPPLPAKQFQIFATIGIYQGFSLPIQIAP
jgi:hypothetical protein